MASYTTFTVYAGGVEGHLSPIYSSGLAAAKKAAGNAKSRYRVVKLRTGTPKQYAAWLAKQEAQPEPEQKRIKLTPAQKSAQTRARNKAKLELNTDDVLF